MNNSAVNLLDFGRQDLAHLFKTWDESAFRADQIIQWVHQKRVLDFTQMTNLSKSLRSRLMGIARLEFPEMVTEQLSEDGTRKWLLRLRDGNCIETVFIPESTRNTLCISSQVGCALNCRFCATAKQGFNRNLTVGEIIGQLWIANQQILAADPNLSISNVVMMGMGEPLLNFDAVIGATDLMMDDHAYGLSKYRVTISSSGIATGIKKLAKCSDTSLAISLHAPNDELRDQLVPINRKYPLESLMDACATYLEMNPKRQITFEYVMLRDVNDSETHARELVALLKRTMLPRCEKHGLKFNLIPFNPFPGTHYLCSRTEQIDRFRDILMKTGFVTTTRKTRGEDIAAACGQLVGKFDDKTRRSKQHQEAKQQNKSQ